MKARTQALKDCICGDENQVDGDSRTKYGESEIDCERAETTGYPTPIFVTGLEVQGLIVAEMQNSISHRNASVLTVLVV